MSTHDELVEKAFSVVHEAAYTREISVREESSSKESSNFSKSQAEGILQAWQQRRDVSHLKLFIMRQGKRSKYYNTAKKLLSVIEELERANRVDSITDLLGYIVWLVDVVSDDRYALDKLSKSKSFDEFVSLYAQGAHGQ